MGTVSSRPRELLGTIGYGLIRLSLNIVITILIASSSLQVLLNSYAERLGFTTTLFVFLSNELNSSALLLMVLSLLLPARGM